ncbi:serine/threonine-protein kinase HAL4/sat4 [Blyttiomyces sp. JEL0837]|nr:serine/threonine-protein kinase HAL4/sat4 [Blyttiomyces sp. JEL0837]
MHTNASVNKQNRHGHAEPRKPVTIEPTTRMPQSTHSPTSASKGATAVASNSPSASPLPSTSATATTTTNTQNKKHGILYRIFHPHEEELAGNGGSGGTTGIFGRSRRTYTSGSESDFDTSGMTSEDESSAHYSSRHAPTSKFMQPASSISRSASPSGQVSANALSPSNSATTVVVDFDSDDSDGHNNYQAHPVATPLDTLRTRAPPTMSLSKCSYESGESDSDNEGLQFGTRNRGKLQKMHFYNQTQPQPQYQQQQPQQTGKDYGTIGLRTARSTHNIFKDLLTGGSTVGFMNQQGHGLSRPNSPSPPNPFSNNKGGFHAHCEDSTASAASSGGNTNATSPAGSDADDHHTLATVFKNFVGYHPVARKTKSLRNLKSDSNNTIKGNGDWTDGNSNNSNNSNTNSDTNNSKNTTNSVDRPSTGIKRRGSVKSLKTAKSFENLRNVFKIPAPTFRVDVSSGSLVSGMPEHQNPQHHLHGGDAGTDSHFLSPNSAAYPKQGSEASISRSPSHCSLSDKYGKKEKEILGKGANAVIRLCCAVDSDKKFAVKEFRKRKKGESQKEYVKKLIAEFCISSSLDHENIIKTVDLIEDERKEWCVVMEFAAGGDLYSKIRNGQLKDQMEINCYFKQLLKGVHYLHSMGVAHRDLKPENLLLDESHRILKITDFGVSEVFRTPFGSHCSKAHGLRGSGPYIAPEEFEEGDYVQELVDVWAVGIV